MTTHVPLGPNGEWKNSQRVPQAGEWVDQDGRIKFFPVGATFPPLAGLRWRSDRGPSYWILVDEAVAAA
jgi:hypothetical protein